jgi:hypothetical protein
METRCRIAAWEQHYGTTAAVKGPPALTLRVNRVMESWETAIVANFPALGPGTDGLEGLGLQDSLIWDVSQPNGSVVAYIAGMRTRDDLFQNARSKTGDQPIPPSESVLHGRLRIPGGPTLRGRS